MNKKINKTNRIIAFYSEVDGRRYQLMLLKTDGQNVYGWTWLDVPDTIVRTSQGKQTLCFETRGSHISHHWSGRKHRRLELKSGGDDRPFNGNGASWDDISAWRQFFVIGVPLAEKLEVVESGPWNHANQEVIFRSSEFGANQLWLNVLITKNNWIEHLRSEYVASWVLKHDPLSIVIGVWD